MYDCHSNLNTALLSFPAFKRKSRLPGTVWRGTYLLRPTVHTIIECPRLPGTITVEWFLASAHRLCVRSPCQHISRKRTFDENSCAISITSPKVDFRPRNPTCYGGDAGTSPGERPHDVIAGESPARRDFPR